MIDIETAPHTAHVWGLWDQSVGLPQLLESSRVLCFSYKWLNQEGISFSCEIGKGGHKAMIERAHALLSQADAVCTYNGDKFDLPTLNKEFVIYGLPPPAPYKKIDLFKVAKKRFRFASNKLDYVAQALGVGRKLKHSGHELWVKCMVGDRTAWKEMRAYNMQDVNVLEQVHNKMLPWIDNYPNHSLHSGHNGMVCTNCGGTHLQQRGFATTKVARYARLHCQDCGTWLRTRTSELPKEKSKSVLVQA